MATVDGNVSHLSVPRDVDCSRLRYRWPAEESTTRRAALSRITSLITAWRSRLNHSLVFLEKLYRDATYVDLRGRTSSQRRNITKASWLAQRLSSAGEIASSPQLTRLRVTSYSLVFSVVDVSPKTCPRWSEGPTTKAKTRVCQPFCQNSSLKLYLWTSRTFREFHLKAMFVRRDYRGQRTLLAGFSAVSYEESSQKTSVLVKGKETVIFVPWVSDLLSVEEWRVSGTFLSDEHPLAMAYTNGK